MKKVLVLDFIDSEAKRFSLRIADPKEDLVPEDVEEAINHIISMNPFERAALIRIDKAYIVTTTQEQLVFGA